MVQQQTPARQAVAIPQRPTQTATKTSGTHRAAMELQTRHLFVHPHAHQTLVLAGTLMHRAEVPSAAPAHLPLAVHGTLSARSAPQLHNQPHQQVYIKITRSIHGWLLQVSDLSSSSLYCVSLKMRVDAVFCCCRLVVVYIKVNMKKNQHNKKKYQHSINPCGAKKNERKEKRSKKYTSTVHIITIIPNRKSEQTFPVFGKRGANNFLPYYHHPWQ
jgi:hypothetical protein